ncbi:MAG: aspartate kinase [Clostridium sp.]|nr:aspartate kinase [Clostridium sp.]
MKVMKFGGTSVGTAESLANVKKIVEAVDEPAIVVVSALGGITDRLIAAARLAEAGEDWRGEFGFITERHHSVISGIVPEAKQPAVTAEVDVLLAELERLYTGVALLNDLSEKVLDRIVSFGERMSTAIVGSIIEGIRRVYSPDFIRTVRRYGRNRLDSAATDALIARCLEGADRDGSLILTAGFISADADGTITNLGRGGSDYTAAILAAAFDADLLEIWTDVDGFMTADPRKIPEASIIDEMTFVEAMELCNFGAKVVYPPTIYPVFHKSIPIDIRNTFNPSAPGTRIYDSRDCRHPLGGVTGISSLNACAMIPVCGSGASSFAGRAFNALARKGIDIYLSGNTPDDDTIGLTVRSADLTSAVEELTLEFQPELQSGALTLPEPTTDLAIIAAVGENLTDQASLHESVCRALAGAGIRVIASTEGTSGSNVAAVVGMADETAALKTLHALAIPSKQKPQ